MAIASLMHINVKSRRLNWNSLIHCPYLFLLAETLESQDSLLPQETLSDYQSHKGPHPEETLLIFSNQA